MSSRKSLACLIRKLLCLKVLDARREEAEQAAALAAPSMESEADSSLVETPEDDS